MSIAPNQSCKFVDGGIETAITYLSPRSGRRHKAWGAASEASKPQDHPPKGISAREAAGSRLRNARHRWTDIREIMLNQMAAAHFAGSLHFLITYLGFRFAPPQALRQRPLRGLRYINPLSRP